MHSCWQCLSILLVRCYPDQCSIGTEGSECGPKQPRLVSGWLTKSPTPAQPTTFNWWKLSRNRTINVSLISWLYYDNHHYHLCHHAITVVAPPPPHTANTAICCCGSQTVSFNVIVIAVIIITKLKMVEDIRIFIDETNSWNENNAWCVTHPNSLECKQCWFRKIRIDSSPEFWCECDRDDEDVMKKEGV